MVNKVRVTIAGAPYAIATTDSEKYIASLAKRLDEDITKLLDTNENLSVTKAAVFCAMDYLDEYRKSTGSAENMRSQIQDYIADATRAKLAEDKVKAENEVLRREAAALREQLEKMRNKEARREERAQQAAQQSAAEGECNFTDQRCHCQILTDDCIRAAGCYCADSLLQRRQLGAIHGRIQRNVHRHAPGVAEAHGFLQTVCVKVAGTRAGVEARKAQIYCVCAAEHRSAEHFFTAHRG